ncbi:MAG: Uma2 family endonuclease [Anaerolineae bacterium]|nr:Uma2 family endonuclease [Anaerolineae bacterium]
MLNTRIDLDEFLAVALAPENADRRLQRIDGEIVEVVSNNQSSEIGFTIGSELYSFVRPRKLGRVTGSDGGYTILGEQYIPDCAFVSHQRQPQTTTEAYPEVAPDVVVEVLSPSNTASGDERDRLSRKVANYLAAGCELWLVYPDEKKLERYVAGEPVQTYRSGDTLPGRGLLEGFRLDIASVWPA